MLGRTTASHEVNGARASVSHQVEHTLHVILTGVLGLRSFGVAGIKREARRRSHLKMKRIPAPVSDLMAVVIEAKKVAVGTVRISWKWFFAGRDVEPR